VKNELVTLAQELHDGIAQDLVGLGFSIDNAISHSKDPETRKELRAIRFAISEQTEKVRVEIHRLRNLSPHQTYSTPDFSYQLSQIFNAMFSSIQKQHLYQLLSQTMELVERKKKKVHLVS